jgi:ABC-type glycerol-3-phosphate transport system substrate-binding protein
MNRTTRVLVSALALAGGGLVAVTPAAASGEVVNLTFSSYAFQEPTVAATEAIVAAWNEANPAIQVELILTSADTVQDELTTQFAGGTAPDIIHSESAAILSFAAQGYIADISSYLSDDVKTSVSEGIWSTVTTADGAIIAAPTLLQSYVVFANTDAIEAAGLEVPAGDTLPWDDFEALAVGLTSDDAYGLGWGLRSPTATVMNLALGFGGDFFTGTGEEATLEIGEPELAVPQRIHDLAYTDNALDPVSLTLSGGDALAGFVAEDYALYVGGDYLAQQLVEAEPGFNWTVLPPLAGSESPNQAANPQTFSVTAESEHVEEAAAFIDFAMSAENLAALAQGDWLIPASADARAAVLEATGGENGWDQILASGDYLVAAPFQFATYYPQWKDQIATPAFVSYLTDTISIEDLTAQLTDGWAQVAGQ